MKYTITLVPGDGIGPEVTAAVVEIFKAAGLQIEWEPYMAGAQALLNYGTTLPKALLDSIEKNKLALKGPLTTPIGHGFASANAELRRVLDLYANVRPVRNLPGVPARYENVDIILIRENTEDLYSGIEHVVVPGVVESLKIITEKASTRIARYAFEWAQRSHRKKIAAIHKANIMKLSDGLFLDCCRRVAAEYQEIKYSEVIVDNASMQLILNPGQFDVMLLENLYGDIMSDAAAGLVGGLGVVPSANIGIDYAVFEAVHGSAPDIVGQNAANPTAILLSGLMMLDHIGETATSVRIYKALLSVLAERKSITRDLGGQATTTEYTAAIIQALEDEA
ncbi:MAG: isocitrate dehydrogenase (NAD(+)) [Acidobacteria bacterium]|nr:isocitrate dehydrogenase (NAD(+)) [Acidobacteriota bacterium]MBI3655324.1 isocitrate dehydrogenase (NAD(+)) [Acidobacteriota bacterium]